VSFAGGGQGLGDFEVERVFVPAIVSIVVSCAATSRRNEWRILGVGGKSCSRLTRLSGVGLKKGNEMATGGLSSRLPERLTVFHPRPLHKFWRSFHSHWVRSDTPELVPAWPGGRSLLAGDVKRARKSDVLNRLQAGSYKSEGESWTIVV
jgi:hypothetical protein